MAIARRAVGTIGGADSGNVTPGLPAGHVANDILVLFMLQFDNVVSTVSGWTSKLAVNNGATCRAAVFWLRDNGAVSAPTVTHAAGGTIAAYIAAYSGVDAGLADPFRDIQSSTGTVVSGSTTFAVTAPDLATVVAGDMQAFIGCETGSDTSSVASGNWTPPAGMSEALDGGRVPAGTGHACIELADLIAGVHSSRSATANVTGFAGTKAWIGFQLALSSASSGAAPPAIINRRVMQAVNRASTY